MIKELQERQQRAKSRRSRQQLGLDSDGDDDSSDSDTPAQGQQHKPTAQRKSSRSAGPRSQQQQSGMRFVYQSVLKVLMKQLYSSDWQQHLCNNGKDPKVENWRLQYTLQDPKDQQQQQDQLLSQDASHQQEEQQSQDQGGEGRQQMSRLSCCGCGGSCHEARSKLSFPNSIPLAKEAWSSAPSQEKVAEWVCSCPLLQVDGEHADAAKAAQQFLKRWADLEAGAEAAAEAAKSAWLAGLATAAKHRVAAAEARKAALAGQKGGAGAASAGAALQGGVAGSDFSPSQPAAEDSGGGDKGAVGQGMGGVPAADSKGTDAAEQKGNKLSHEQPNINMGKGGGSDRKGVNSKSCGSRPAAAKSSQIKQRQMQHSKQPKFIPPVSYLPYVPKGRRQAREQSDIRGNAKQMRAALGHIVGHSTSITAAAAAAAAAGAKQVPPPAVAAGPKQVPSPSAAAEALKEGDPAGAGVAAAAAGTTRTRRKRAPGRLNVEHVDTSRFQRTFQTLCLRGVLLNF